MTTTPSSKTIDYSAAHEAQASNSKGNTRFKGLTCDKCKTTETKLLNVSPKILCLSCIETLATENRILCIDERSDAALEKYNKMLKMKDCKQKKFNLRLLLMGIQNKTAPSKHAWLIACCLETSLIKSIYDKKESTFHTLVNFIEPFFENSYSEPMRRAKLLEMESAISCYQKIITGKTDYAQWEFKATDNGSLPSSPTPFYLAQIQPCNWRAIGNTLWGTHSFDSTHEELLSTYPDDPGRQQFEMFNCALKEGYLKNWQQLDNAFQSSKKTHHRVPETRHHVLLANFWPQTLASRQPWWDMRRQFVNKWQQISELLADREGWSECQFPKNGHPYIENIIPRSSLVFGLLMTAETLTMMEIEELPQKKDKSVDYITIMDKIGRSCSNISWIVVYICAHISGQLLRFQHNRCAMIDEYINQYGQMQAKTINFDDPDQTLYSLFDSAIDLISRIIDALENTRQPPPPKLNLPPHRNRSV